MSEDQNTPVQDPEEILRKKRGCLKWSLVVLATFVFSVLLVDWWSKRPKQMLERYLDTEWTDSITRIESEFTYEGFDSIAKIYLEGNPALLRQLISDGGFEQLTHCSYESSISDLPFTGAPDPHSQPLKVYERHQHSSTEYIGLKEDGTSLWYVYLNY